MGESAKAKSGSFEYHTTCKRCNTYIARSTKQGLKEAEQAHRRTCAGPEYTTKHDPKPFTIRSGRYGRVTIDPKTGQPIEIAGHKVKPLIKIEEPKPKDEVVTAEEGAKEAPLIMMPDESAPRIIVPGSGQP